MTELRQREPREHCEPYLVHIRSLPCLICHGKAEPAHLRTGSLAAGKSYTGGGEKSSDKWALPLCRLHHVEQHAAGSEILFWRHYRLDPFAIAMRLWNAWKLATGYTVKDRPARKQRQPRPRKSAPKTSWPKRKMESRNTFKKTEPRGTRQTGG